MKKMLFVTAQNVRLYIGRPEMYEDGALEWRIEENEPKMCGRAFCLKACSATEWIFTSPLNQIMLS
jgi:hypothetical protein